ncbi:hypothetical protein PCE1_004719 [Barthelona sp. PCE]
MPSKADKTKKQMIKLVQKKAMEEAQEYLIAKINEESIDKAELTRVLDIVKGLESAEQLDWSRIEEEAGVGVVYSADEIEGAISAVIAKWEPKIVELRYLQPIAELTDDVKAILPFIPKGDCFHGVSERYNAILGPKTEADEEAIKEHKRQEKAARKGGKKKKQPAPKKDSEKKGGAEAGERFPKPEENKVNPPELLKAHLDRTGGMVVTRFPPEPNGFLHIGHAKAMYLDFGEAEATGGECNLRFDDTNPAAEKQEFIDLIIDCIKWMGYNPTRITYASDNFDRLFELAEELIRKELAYVDFSSKNEISEQRAARVASPFRDTSAEENMRLFHMMRDGMFEEGECSLRMKMDIESPNPNLWDLVAYRIKYVHHARTGDKWCVYPSYDFTHCICDSIEDITHSLCTLEFQSRQESYHWPLIKLGLYQPLVWEMSRLNIDYSVMSKRRINRLIKMGKISNFDDPRLMTLLGLRRRGVHPAAIKEFCSKVSITRNDNTSLSPMAFDAEIRRYYNANALRRFGVTHPLPVTILDFEGAEVEVANHPAEPKHGTRMMRASNKVYIDQSSFKAEGAHPRFYGLKPGGKVNLRYLWPVEYVSHETDENGTPTNVVVRKIADDYDRKVKGNLHWVDQETAIPCEYRIYSLLFSHKTPDGLPDYENYINEDSLEIAHGFIEAGVETMPVETTYQLERVGYFTIDPDTKADQLVMNLTVSLKEGK